MQSPSVKGIINTLLANMRMVISDLIEDITNNHCSLQILVDRTKAFGCANHMWAMIYYGLTLKSWNFHFILNYKSSVKCFFY